MCRGSGKTIILLPKTKRVYLPFVVIRRCYKKEKRRQTACTITSTEASTRNVGSQGRKEKEEEEGRKKILTAISHNDDERSSH